MGRLLGRQHALWLCLSPSSTWSQTTQLLQIRRVFLPPEPWMSYGLEAETRRRGSQGDYDTMRRSVVFVVIPACGRGPLGLGDESNEQSTLCAVRSTDGFGGIVGSSFSLHLSGVRICRTCGANRKLNFIIQDETSNDDHDARICTRVTRHDVVRHASHVP